MVKMKMVLKYLRYFSEHRPYSDKVCVLATTFFELSDEFCLKEGIKMPAVREKELSLSTIDNSASYSS